MKAMKKVLCIMLAVVMASLAFIMPVSAAGATPLIIVDGLGSTTLYKDYGKKTQTKVFSDDEKFLDAMIKEIGDAFVDGCIKYGVNKKDYDAFADSFYPVVNKYLKDIGFKPDGTPRNNTIGFKQLTKPVSSYSKAEKADLTIFGQAVSKKFGEKNTYNFSYDWRKDPVDNAKLLKAYINHVKASTGAKRVNAVGLSMGASILVAYMSLYGGKDLNNVVFNSPAWQGTSLAGNIATNNVKIDIFTYENYLVQLANVSATTHIAAIVFSIIATKEGLSHEYFGEINKAIQGILPRAYTDTVSPYIAGMPGFWSLIPADYYNNAKAFLYGSNLNKNLKAKIDGYHKIQVNAKSIVSSAVREGMRFGVVCGYNCQMIPVSEEYVSSDTVIDTKYMSGGAVCADYLKSFDDWGKGYTQKVKDNHNHISWDRKVDASSSMYPENTWFIKNLQHAGYTETNNTLDITMWLLNAKEQYSIHTSEKYPQFWLYNTYAKKAKPMSSDKNVKGDLNGSGMPTTLDARVALKIAAGLQKPSEQQMLMGDINEDGKITTEDARRILCLAAGVAF